jgi:hypothetical protein
MRWRRMANRHAYKSVSTSLTIRECNRLVDSCKSMKYQVVTAWPLNCIERGVPFGGGAVWFYTLEEDSR